MKIKNILQWLSIIPISIIVVLVANIVLHLIIFKSFPFSVYYLEMIERLISPFVNTFTTIMIGYSIAPKYNFKTAIVLFFILVAFSIYGFIAGYFKLSIGDNAISVLRYGGLPVLFGIFGSITAIYYIKTNNYE